MAMLKHLGQVSPIIPVLEESLSSDSAGIVGCNRQSYKLFNELPLHSNGLQVL